MRRLVTYLNSLLLGVILGMIFVAVVHTYPSHLQEKIHRTGFAIGDEHICALRN